MKAITSTLIHLLELAIAGAIAIGLAYAAKAVLGVDLSSATEVVLTFVVNGLMKGARASEAVPVPDYVNGK